MSCDEPISRRFDQPVVVVPPSLVIGDLQEDHGSFSIWQIVFTISKFSVCVLDIGNLPAFEAQLPTAQLRGS